MEDKQKDTTVSRDQGKTDPRVAKVMKKTIFDLKKNQALTKQYKEWLKGNING